MQINFYMGDIDRKLFHEYIFSRDGYITPEKWEVENIPIANSEHQIEIDCFNLKIFKEDVFTEKNFTDKSWVTYLEQFQKFHVHGPGMQYLKSYANDKGLIRGRIYMGVVSPISFAKPGDNDPNRFSKYNDRYKQLENFYKSCCRYIRKNFRKDAAGFYHGPQSDELERNGIAKLQFNM